MELLPEVRRVGVKHGPRVRDLDLPRARANLLLELARQPDDETDEIARVVRHCLDHAIHRGVVHDEDETRCQRDCAAALRRTARDREERLRERRAAEVHRIDDLARRRVSRQERRKLYVRGTVDDEAEVLARGQRDRDEHRLVVPRSRETLGRDQHDGLRRLGGVRGASCGEDDQEGSEGAQDEGCKLHVELLAAGWDTPSEPSLATSGYQGISLTGECGYSCNVGLQESLPRDGWPWGPPTRGFSRRSR